VTRHDAIPPVPATPDHTPGTAPDHTPGPTPDAKPDRGTDATRGPAPAGRAAQPPWAAPADPAAAGAIALRAMTRADLPAVLRLEHDLFGDEAWSEAMLVSELDGAEASGRYYLVAEDTQPAGNGSCARPAEDSGRLVGYAGLLSPDGGQADVLTMAVARERWGQRVGARLLDALVAEAARRGCTDVFLEVRVDNDRAQRLYRSRGFAEIGIRRGYYQPSGTDALVMQLSLPRPRRFGFSGTRRSGTKHGDPKPAAGGPR
jgi:[ribosomal protein S18]-alanine N-acetyltransferase